MSRRFREFAFAEVGVGEWVGEDLLFNDSLNYTIIAKTNLEVIEFFTSDLKNLLIPAFYKFM